MNFNLSMPVSVLVDADPSDLPGRADFEFDAIVGKISPKGARVVAVYAVEVIGLAGEDSVENALKAARDSFGLTPKQHCFGMIDMVFARMAEANAHLPVSEKQTKVITDLIEALRTGEHWDNGVVLQVAAMNPRVREAWTTQLELVFTQGEYASARKALSERYQVWPGLVKATVQVAKSLTANVEVPV